MSQGCVLFVSDSLLGSQSYYFRSHKPLESGVKMGILLSCYADFRSSLAGKIGFENLKININK